MIVGLHQIHRLLQLVQVLFQHFTILKTVHKLSQVLDILGQSRYSAGAYMLDISGQWKSLRKYKPELTGT